MTEVAKITPLRDKRWLTPIEKNLDRLPLWATQKQSKDPERTFALPWIGPGARLVTHSTGRIGNLRVSDKLTLVALLELWHQQGKPETGRIQFRISVLLNLLDLDSGGSDYEHLKRSLKRLRYCGVDFIQCFYGADVGGIRRTETHNILANLTLNEPIRHRNGLEQLTFDFSAAQLDLEFVENLLGSRSRLISLPLLKSLSEIGVLLEGYVGRVLAKQPEVTKDVHALWKELALKTDFAKGYASNLKPKMIRELDKLVADPTHPLGSYRFTKSKQPRHLNLVLVRVSGRVVSFSPSSKSEKGTRDAGNPGSRDPGKSFKADRGLTRIDPGAALERTTASKPRREIPRNSEAEAEYLTEQMLEVFGNPRANARVFKIIAQRTPSDIIFKHLSEVKQERATIRKPAAVFATKCLNWLEEAGVPHPVKRRPKQPEA